MQEIMDESDRLTQFIEDRAKDTLLRFARKRQERQNNGQINPRLGAVIGSVGTPRRVSFFGRSRKPRTRKGFHAWMPPPIVFMLWH